MTNKEGAPISKELEDQRGFSRDLLRFYNKFIDNLVGVVDTLSKIQEAHPEKYKIIKELQINPQKIPEFLSMLDEEDAKTLLYRIIEAGQFDRRLSRMYDLTIEEQKELARDLKAFAQKVNEDVEKMEKKINSKQNVAATNTK